MKFLPLYLCILELRLLVLWLHLAAPLGSLPELGVGIIHIVDTRPAGSAVHCEVTTASEAPEFVTGPVPVPPAKPAMFLSCVTVPSLGRKRDHRIPGQQAW